MPHAYKVGREVNVWLVHGLDCRSLHGDSLEADLRSRDLTVNALAVDEQGRLYGHPDAINDLWNGVLRPTNSDAFLLDPARVFRVARFAAQFPDFTLHADTILQMRKLGGTEALGALPAERVCQEVRRALSCACPSRLIDTLDQGNCLGLWLAELEQAANIPAGPELYHDESVLEHTGQIMDKVAGDPLAVWMALCHDLGKVGTDPDLLPHHHGHEHRGEVAATALAERLAMPVLYRKAGALAARLHMTAGRYQTCRPGTRRDIVWKVHTANLHEPFWKFVEADSGRAMLPQVNADLAKILSVSLPVAWRDRGQASGIHLREMQCQALGLMKSP